MTCSNELPEDFKCERFSLTHMGDLKCNLETKEVTDATGKVVGSFEEVNGVVNVTLTTTLKALV